MRTKISTEEKANLVNQYLNGESAQNICFINNISKSTFYTWIKQYKNCVDDTNKVYTLMDIQKLQAKIDRQSKAIDILKLVNCTVHSPLKEKLYELEKIKDSYSVKLLCETLEVDRGTFYNHILRNKKSDTIYKKRKEEMTILVGEIFNDSNQIYGAKKIAAVLHDKGIKISASYVKDIMNTLNISSVRTSAKKDYKRLNGQSKSNLVSQHLKVKKPNEIWVSDTTCFKIKNKWYYICAVIDLYSRKVISHKISSKHTTNLISGTFKCAYKNRNPKSNLIFHSDRGSQYTSATFTNLLIGLNVTQSFSRSGRPCDNAVMESFFASLKKEEIYRKEYTSYYNFSNSINKYIEFYNDKRPHSTLGNKSPNSYEQAFYRKR